MHPNGGDQCRICGKPLSDPRSIELGIGPICRRKIKSSEHQKRDNNMFGNRAQYTWGTDGPVLWLEDHGINCRSLTNDIENCLVEVQAQLGANQPLTNYFIIYRDSEMEWDALEIKEFGDWSSDHQWLESSKKTGRPYWSHSIKINFKYLKSATFALAKVEVQEMANYCHPCLKFSEVKAEEGEADRVPI